jgi:hypothetical protein
MGYIGMKLDLHPNTMAQRVIENIDKTLEVFTPRSKFEFINTNEFKVETIPHKLLY